MKFLVDTHVLLWAGLVGSHLQSTGKLSKAAQAFLSDESNKLYFSPAAVWEVSIKNALGKEDFSVDPHVFRRELLENGYEEIPISSAHTVEAGGLPPHHTDPFDRLMIAQATVEGIYLLTHDKKIEAYKGPSPIMMV